MLALLQLDTVHYNILTIQYDVVYVYKMGVYILVSIFGMQICQN